MSKRGLAVLAGWGVSAALVAGCSADGGGSSESAATSPGAAPSVAQVKTVNPPSPSASPTAPETVMPSAGSSSTHTDERADQQAALAAGTTASDRVGRGTVTSIDLERGGTVWEVSVVTSNGTEHTVRVSRNGHRVVSGPRAEQEGADDRAENRREAHGATVGYQEAARRVLGARQGRITELNLDEERGQVVWEADVRRSGTTYEVTVDAASGKILKNEPAGR